MTEGAYNLDVAFSFLHQDEGIAFKISDLLQDRYKTFVFSKAQETIAGTDGLETFSKVFGFEARTVGWLSQAGKQHSTKDLVEVMMKRFMDLQEKQMKRRSSR